MLICDPWICDPCLRRLMQEQAGGLFGSARSRARRSEKIIGVDHDPTCPACVDLAEKIGKLDALAGDPAATEGEKAAAIAARSRLADRLAAEARS